LSLAVVLNVTAGKEVKLVHPSHAWFKPVALDRFKAGKDVKAVQFFHAAVKLMSSSAWVENVIAGKEVKLASVQPLHASVKFVPLERFRAGNDSSWVQPSHAPVKLMSSSAWVLNVQALNEVIAVLPFHVVLKLVPLDRFKAGNVVRVVH
jgi:hypothetical protein